MSGGIIAGVLAGTLGALVLGVFTSLLTKETEGFIDALPGLVLRLARRRLPADGRDDLYDEWAAELHIALHQTEGRPLSRLVLGIRYAAGLLRTARRIADELGPARHSTQERWDDHGPADAPAGLVHGELTADLVGLVAPRSLAGGPTVRRMVLGSELRRLRTRRQITPDEAGFAIRASRSTVDRIERGQEQLRERDIADLLTLYGVTDPAERRSLLSLATRANDPGWWHRFDDTLPTWSDGYTGLEETASKIRSYGAQFVPALLQAEDYARAVTCLGHPEAPAHEIERRVDVRMRRQALLHGENPPHFWAVIDELTLRRPLADIPALRKQIRHLIDLTRLPHVTLQILPFVRGGLAVTGGPFSMLRFADPDLPDVVHLDQLTSALYLDKREDVDHYWVVMERICVDAEPVDATCEILCRILEEL
jgi:transcriptional regulator with XRE-family HTH domain